MSRGASLGGATFNGVVPATGITAEPFDDGTSSELKSMCSGSSCASVSLYRREGVGRRFTSTKLRHSWDLLIGCDGLRLEVLHSRLSGKKQVFLDGKLVFQTRQRNLSWSVAHPSGTQISLTSKGGSIVLHCEDSKTTADEELASEGFSTETLPPAAMTATKAKAPSSQTEWFTICSDDDPAAGDLECRDEGAVVLEKLPFGGTGGTEGPQNMTCTSPSVTFRAPLGFAVQTVTPDEQPPIPGCIDDSARLNAEHSRLLAALASRDAQIASLHSLLCQRRTQSGNLVHPPEGTRLVAKVHEAAAQPNDGHSADYTNLRRCSMEYTMESFSTTAASSKQSFSTSSSSLHPHELLASRPLVSSATSSEAGSMARHKFREFGNMPPRSVVEPHHMAHNCSDTPGAPCRQHREILQPEPKLWSSMATSALQAEQACGTNPAAEVPITTGTQAPSQEDLLQSTRLLSCDIQKPKVAQRVDVASFASAAPYKVRPPHTVASACTATVICQEDLEATRLLAPLRQSDKSCPVPSPSTHAVHVNVEVVDSKMSRSTDAATRSISTPRQPLAPLRAGCISRQRSATVGPTHVPKLAIHMQPQLTVRAAPRNFQEPIGGPGGIAWQLPARRPMQPSAGSIHRSTSAPWPAGKFTPRRLPGLMLAPGCSAVTPVGFTMSPGPAA
eukprot:gnl/TRDRNA2_/TRDRNA2_191871_c0_seq1.p1 gnl/TRDRNA2_/TRDRNA2_191871_c0~~gnl/TRDRNA2_/TRDRNA2_191871_c0_seq1.p1  ORF type:complete len:673 (-),score=73.03 gnl/TRDRNA2_/TRDRNA2_191871_c0_seq1:60-2078(-)